VRALIYGVADGAEAVSLLATLAPAPQDPVEIVGRDVDAALLDAARTWTYLPGHVPDGTDLLRYDQVLEPRPGGGWALREAYRGMVRYEAGDVREAAADSSGDYHVVCCQNTLVMFPAETVPDVVAGLAARTAPGGLLVLGGGPLGVITPAAAASGCVPVLDQVGAVHEAWTVQRAFWDNQVRPCWALEPYDAGHAEGPGRYATVFRKAAGPRL
jgi:hypothetical protein